MLATCDVRMTFIKKAMAKQTTKLPIGEKKKKKNMASNYRAIIICKKGKEEEEKAMEMETKQKYHRHMQ